MPRMLKCLLSSLCGLCLWAAGGSGAVLAAPAPLYTPTMIDAPGRWLVFGEALNDHGQVAGFADRTAFLWTPTTGLLDLGTLGHRYSRALSINNSGQLTGSYSEDGSDSRAFLYSGGTMTDVSPSSGSAGGNAINEQGHVAGNFEGGAFVRDGQNTLTLQVPSGISGFVPMSINDRGHVVGFGIDSQVGHRRALLHRNGETTSLLPDAATSFAKAVNQSGQVAGDYVMDLPHARQKGFLYTDGVVTDVVGLADHVEVRGLNDAGEVVGRAWDSGGPLVPFLFSDGEMIDLRTRLDPAFLQDWTISSVDDINNRGQILVNAMHRLAELDQMVPFLLSPVPEPQTLALLLGGLALLCWRLRHRQR